MAYFHTWKKLGYKSSKTAKVCNGKGVKWLASSFKLFYQRWCPEKHNLWFLRDVFPVWLRLLNNRNTEFLGMHHSSACPLLDIVVLCFCFLTFLLFHIHMRANSACVLPPWLEFFHFLLFFPSPLLLGLFAKSS